MSWAHGYWPRDQHDYLLELVRKDHGGQLPDWALAVDLVHHVDRANHPTRPVPFPGRRELQKRWQMSERQTRSALQDEGWQAKAELARLRLPTRHLNGHVDQDTIVPVAVPPASPWASPPRTREAAQPTGNVPVAVPPASPSVSTRALDRSHGPTVPTDPDQTIVGQASREGGDPSPVPTPTAVLVLDPAPAPRRRQAPPERGLPAGYAEAEDYWRKTLGPAVGVEHPRPIDPGGKLGRRLIAELKANGVDDVLAAMHFVAESEHNTARWNREHKYGLITVLRHVEEYAPLDTVDVCSPSDRGNSHEHYVAPTKTEAELDLIIAQLRADGVIAAGPEAQAK